MCCRRQLRSRYRRRGRAGDPVLACGHLFWKLQHRVARTAAVPGSRYRGAPVKADRSAVEVDEIHYEIECCNDVSDHHPVAVMPLEVDGNVVGRSNEKRTGHGRACHRRPEEGARHFRLQVQLADLIGFGDLVKGDLLGATVPGYDASEDKMTKAGALAGSRLGVGVANCRLLVLICRQELPEPVAQLFDRICASCRIATPGCANLDFLDRGQLGCGAAGDRQARNANSDQGAGNSLQRIIPLVSSDGSRLGSRLRMLATSRKSAATPAGQSPSRL